MYLFMYEMRMAGNIDSLIGNQEHLRLRVFVMVGNWNSRGLLYLFRIRIS